VRGDWVLGARVTSLDGESIGSIEDLILDQEDGSVNAAVVSVGGFLGFGGKQIAVDWSELNINYDE
jgi:sporulation protein YlmC with PRC-barrel domain